MGIVVYNGVSSEEMGIVVEHPPKYSFPQRDFEVTHVPGRNGDVVFDTGSYQNVTREYEIAIGDENKDFTPQANLISEWLHSSRGYARLEDTYEPEYYRLAMFKDEGTIENLLQHMGRITVAFNCKPQRFLKSGDVTIELNKSGSLLVNPTKFPSRPIIKVFGSGSGVFAIHNKVTGKNYTVTISNIDQYVTINSDLMDAYKDTLNKNSTITLSSGFPILDQDVNELTWSGGITKVEVQAKWWTL